MSKEVILSVKIDGNGAIKSVENLTEAIDESREASEKASKETQKQLESVQKASKSASSGIATVGKAFKGLGTAIKAIGIGLLIAAAAKLSEVFKSNQIVVDGLSVVMNTISVVFNQVTDIILGAYDQVKEATGGFDALKTVLTNLLKIGLKPLQFAFNGLKLGILEVQKAYEKWIGGNDPERIAELEQSITSTKERLSELAEETANSAIAIRDNFGEALSEVGEIGKGVASAVGEAIEKVDISKAFDSGKALTQLQNGFERLEIEQQGLIESYDRQAELQRQLRDNEFASISDRIAANQELGTILTQQAEAEKKTVNERIKILEAEQRLKGTSTQLENEILKLRNELVAVDAKVAGFKSEQLTNEVALLKERNELEQTGFDRTLDRIIRRKEAEIELTDSEVEQFQKRQELLDFETERRKAILEEEVEKYEEGTQAKQDAEQDLRDFLADQAIKKKKLAKEVADYDVETEKAKNAQKAALEQQALNNLTTGLGGIAALLGEQSKFGKALAVTIAIIDTFAAANKALRQGGAFGGLAVAGVVAQGIANVRQITAQKLPSPPSFAKGSSGGSRPTPTITPPSFNIVGGTPESQLADIIAQSDSEPVKAYVVASEVSSQQSLDRNIQNEASIG